MDIAPVVDRHGPRYKFGDHVIFHDDAQQEIRGVVRDRDDYPDRTMFLIELDNDEGWYHATLLKK